MAASYSTDLITVTSNDTNSMVEPTATSPEAWTYLNAFTSAETDYFIQGTACTSATMKVGLGGALTNNLSFTLGTDDAVLCWAYYWAPGGMDVEANGGARQMIGSAQNAFYWVTQSGGDDWLYGGWRCFAMGNPTQITVNTVGSPTSTYSYTGWAAKLLFVPGKGNPFGVDAIRRGRGTIKMTGDTANFTEVEEFNSKNSTAARTGFTLLDSGYHRLGLFQYQNGSYLWKGRLLIGETGVVSCTFSDSNKSILVENTKNVTANYNLIEVQHTGTTLNWVGVSITALGTVARGRFLVTDAPTLVSMDSCTFTDMDSFTFNGSGTQTIISTIFRRCGLITRGAATFNKCTFDKPSGAICISSSNLSSMSKCNFISDGTGYAIDLGTVSSTTTMSYDNTHSGYATSNGSTGNEVIKVNVAAGQTLTINVAATGDTPSVHNIGTGSVSVVAGQKTLTVSGFITGSDVVIMSQGTTTVLQSVYDASSTTLDYTYSYAASTYVTIRAMAETKLAWEQDYLLPNADSTVTVVQQTDRNYQP